MFAEIGCHVRGIFFCVCFVKPNCVTHRLGASLGSTIMRQTIGSEGYVFVACSHPHISHKSSGTVGTPRILFSVILASYAAEHATLPNKKRV